MNCNKQLISVLFTFFLLTSCHSLPKVSVSWEENQTEEQAQEEIDNDKSSTETKEPETENKTEQKVATQTESEELEAVPQSSANNENIKPETITQSSSGMTPQQLNRRAKYFTVRIDGASNGSGVIVEESDNTYTVLTNWHTVEEPQEYTIQTSDGREHKVNYQQVQQLSGVDLALVKFTSEKNYQTAEIGDSDFLSEGQTVHLAGYPGIKTNDDRIYRFYNLNIVSLLDTPINQGYSLLYEGETISGMSGSPLLDDNGKLVGIHGIYRVDDPQIRKGSSYAIPINTYKELVAEKPEATDTVASQPISIITKQGNKSAGDSLTTQNKQARNKQSQTIPEISWESSLNSFDLNTEANIGKQFSFKCPTAPANFQASIWGSDNYTTDSSICLSGVHAGVITRDGGIVFLQLNPGQQLYTGSERNDVATEDWGSYDTSFSFVSNSIAANDQQPQTTLKPTPTENSTEPNSETKSSGGNLIGLEDTPSPNKEMIIDLKNSGVFDNLGWDFNLLEPITRGECMALIYYANNAVRSEKNHLRLAPSYDPGFTDIDSSHPAYKYVQALANAGYSVGYPDNTFKPDLPITREELIGIKVPLDIGTQEDRDDNEWDFNDYEQIDRKFKSDINWDNRIQGDKGSNIERAFGSIKSLKPKQPVWGYEAAASLWQFGDSSGWLENGETAIDQPE